MQKILWGMFLLVGTLFSSELVWQKDITTAFEKAQKENKVVMVVVEGEHCRWCKKMKHRTLSDDSVLERLEPYIIVKVMREDTEDVKDLPAINGVPTIFFLKANKKTIETVVGYYNIVDFTSFIDSVEKKVPLKK
jgi:thioredoxin-related protein